MAAICAIRSSSCRLVPQPPRLRGALLAVMTIFATGCGESPDPRPDTASAPPPAQDVVARHAEITITQDELDGLILGLPIGRRPKPGEDLDAWYRQQIREMLVNRRLHDEALQSDIATLPGFGARQVEVARQFVVNSCLRKRSAESEPLTEQQLNDAYEARRENLKAPERRAAFHIFQRHRNSGDAAGTRERIEALRTRVLNGENFKRLASMHSDSESRHREGTLGWVEPGVLPKGFEDAIFALPEGVPSEPVTTRDGAHIFFVDTILPARVLGLQEAMPKLLEALQQEQSRQILLDMTAGIDDPLGLPTRDRFVEVTQARQTDAVMLSDGDYTLTLADFRAQLRQAFVRSGRSAQSPDSVSIEASWRFLNDLRMRALAYRLCLQEGVVTQSEIDTTVQRWRDEVLVVNQRNRRLLELARADEGILRSHYDNNISRFTSAPKWDLRRLVIPLGDSASTLLARLEQAASDDDTSLDRLQAELGGELESLGSLSLAELGASQPKLPALVAPLSPGQLSPPYRSGQNLEIVAVLAREEPEALPFDQVRDQVAMDMVDHNTPQLYRRLAESVLASAPVEIFEEPLSAVKAAGIPQPDISVEELERMLEDL